MVNAASQERLPEHFPTAIVSSMAFLVVFAAAAAPIPLYSTYQEAIGITDSEVSLTIVFYLVGCMVVLFFIGKLSDAFGRRPLTAVSLGLCILGCALFMGLDSGLGLQLARFVQGLSAAFAMSATCAYVVDSAYDRYRTLGIAISSCGSLIGITIGSLATGLIGSALADAGVVYVVLIVWAALVLVALPFVHETVPKARRIPPRQAIHPILSIPKSVRGMYPIAAGLYICMWGVGMFFQSLSSTVSVAYFGAAGTLIPSLVLAASMAPSILGGPLDARLAPKRSLVLTLVLYAVSCVGMLASMLAGAIVPYLLFDVLFGLAAGLGLSLGLHLLVSVSDAADNAEVVSLINFTAYVGSTIMSTAMTALTTVLALAPVFAVMALVGAVVLAPGSFAAFKRL